MTILVGVKCCDGIVIGTDSAVTSAPVPGMSAMTETGASKIEFPFANEPLIVATTGSVGMSLRLHYELRANFTEGKAIKNSLRNNPIKFPTDLATIVTENFRKTFSPVMSNPQIGFQLGALVGFVCKDEPHLVEFDSVQFQPDLKGVIDGNGRWRTRPYATMGSGQMMGDPFLAEAHSLLFGKDSATTLQQGRIIATWALKHVIKYNTGGIGGPIQLAVIDKTDKGWRAHSIDAGECEQVVAQLEEHIRGFWNEPDDRGAEVDASKGVAAEVGGR
jgi:hypothetical protein